MIAFLVVLNNLLNEGYVDKLFLSRRFRQYFHSELSEAIEPDSVTIAEGVLFESRQPDTHFPLFADALFPLLVRKSR